MTACFEIIFILLSAIMVAGRIPTIQEIAREQNAQIMSGLRALELDDGPGPEGGDQSATGCDPGAMTCENNELTVCGIGRVEVKLPCSSFFGGRPGFCDCEGTQCTSERPNCYQAQAASCDEPGEKLPDPGDCRQFTYCDDSKQKATLRCPAGMVYNPDAAACHSSVICRRLTCNRRKIMEWIPFPQAPQYYLFCMGGTGEVRKCTQDGYAMKDNKCQFACKKEGLFRDPLPGNCNKGMWHTCVRRGLTFIHKTELCPKEDGQQKYFDEAVGVCRTSNTCESTPDATPGVTEQTPKSSPSPGRRIMS